MHVLRWATAAAVCALVTASNVAAQQNAGNPPATAHMVAWPATVSIQPNKAATPASAPSQWSTEDIELATDRKSVV